MSPATRILRVLLGINGGATIAAAIVLALAPAAIPEWAGIVLSPSQNLLAYLLAASELAIGALCLLALRSGDAGVIRLTVGVLIVFHLASGLAGLAAFIGHPNAVVLWNSALRAVMVAVLGGAQWRAGRGLRPTCTNEAQREEMPAPK